MLEDDGADSVGRNDKVARLSDIFTDVHLKCKGIDSQLRYGMLKWAYHAKCISSNQQHSSNQQLIEENSFLSQK